MAYHDNREQIYRDVFVRKAYRLLMNYHHFDFEDMVEYIDHKYLNEFLSSSSKKIFNYFFANLKDDSHSLLKYSCKNGHIGLVYFLISSHFETISQCEREIWPLHMACEANDFKMVTLLLDMGFDINALDKAYNKPISYARSLDIIIYLLEYGAIIEACYDLFYVVFDAYKRGHDMLNKFISIVDIRFLSNGCEIHDNTITHYACLHGYTGLLGLLIERGIDLEVVNHCEERPVHYACQGHQIETLRLLIDNNVDLNSKNCRDETPIYIACEEQYPDMLEILYSKGVDLNHECGNGEKLPIHVACKTGNIEIVKWLINKGVNLDVYDRYLSTPVHYACRYGRIEILKLLISEGACLTSINDEHNMPIHDAAINGYEEIIRILMYWGINLDEKSGGNNTPLHYACKYGRMELVKSLIANKVDLNATNNDNLTPIQLASKYGYLKIVKLLIDNGVDVDDYYHDRF